MLLLQWKPERGSAFIKYIQSSNENFNSFGAKKGSSEKTAYSLNLATWAWPILDDNSRDSHWGMEAKIWSSRGNGSSSGLCENAHVWCGKYEQDSPVMFLSTTLSPCHTHDSKSLLPESLSTTNHMIYDQQKTRWPDDLQPNNVRKKKNLNNKFDSEVRTQMGMCCERPHLD